MRTFQDFQRNAEKLNERGNFADMTNEADYILQKVVKDQRLIDVRLIAPSSFLHHILLIFNAAA